MRGEPVRVLWLIKGLGPGGAERLLVNLARAHDRERVRPDVAYLLAGKAHLVAELEELGVSAHCLNATSNLDPMWPLRLRSLVRREGYDVVHIHSPMVGALARPVLRAMARPPIIVSTEHVPWHTTARATRIANAVTFGLEDAHIAVSDEVRASMSEPHRVATVALEHGISLEAVRAQRGERARIRAELGVADDEVLICTIANHRAQKAYPDLLEAARLTIERNPRARFVAVGQGPLEAQTRAQHAALGLGDRFRLLGYRADATAILAASDIFTLASTYEGLPVALMESLALGVPVVATAVGGVAETITDDREGRLVPPRRPDLLAKELDEVATDDALRARLAADAAALGDRFDARRAARALEDLYDGLRHVEVLHVISDTDRRGAQVFASDLDAAFGARGPSSRIVALRPGRSGAALDVPVLGVRSRSPATLAALRRRVRRARVVIAHGSTTLAACAAACAGTGVPFVYRSIGDPRFWLDTPGKRARVATYLRRARAIVALWPDAAEHVRSLTNVPVHTIPNATSRAGAPGPDPASARARLGLLADGPVVALIGSLSDEKAPLDAVDAVAGLGGSTLLVVGDGPLRAAVEARARDAGLTIRLMGALDDIADVLVASDVLVCPSRTEGIPGVALEAAAAGVPVVASDVGGVPHMFASGVAGEAVAHGDIAAMTAALRRALAAPRPRPGVPEAFTIEAVARAWAHLVEAL